jgi:hypothetical protein
MRNRLLIRYLLSVMVPMIVLCANAWAGPYFFDDFSDGDPADGSPVNWLDVGDELHSGYTLTPEGLQLGSATAADLDGMPYIYRDVSVRAQIKRTSNHTDGNWVSGLVVRWNDGGPGGYWIEVRPPNRFWLGHRNRYVLRTAGLPFNVDEQEFIIRVDAVGDQIKCWCWPADEPMPDEPQITLVEDVVPDGTFALYAGTQGGQAIYRWAEAVSLEVPIIDFNGDGKVDIKDLLKMIQYWNQDELSVDINGDGTVDEKDLEILMEYWNQNVDDPTLLAHWALDETEGLIAYDSAGTNDAVLSGDPVWQPTMGQLDGALELDGDEDCIITNSVLNPADGPFSVIAWAKGGAAGQVVVSESSSNWLCTDPSNGELTTELACQGRSSVPLLSETIITDGEWHRLGLVWDGSNRTLYVDDVVVAQDTQDSLKSSNSGLYIGASKAM